MTLRDLQNTTARRCRAVYAWCMDVMDGMWPFFLMLTFCGFIVVVLVWTIDTSNTETYGPEIVMECVRFKSDHGIDSSYVKRCEIPHTDDVCYISHRGIYCMTGRSSVVHGERDP